MAKPWDVRLLTVEARLAQAKQKTDRLINHVCELVRLHESNRIITYSDAFSRQIPQSDAFKDFQQAMHSFEITRLCALWDGPANDRESIPAVMHLIDDGQVLMAAEQAIAEGWKSRGRLDDFEQMKSTEIGSKLRRAVKVARTIGKSKRLKRIQKFRHKYLAHSLTPPLVSNPKYGHERMLVKASIEIVERLYLGLSNGGFEFSDVVRQARCSAEQLWSNCTFSVPR